MPSLAAVVPLDPEPVPQEVTVHQDGATEVVVQSRQAHHNVPEPCFFFCLSAIDSSICSVVGVLIYSSRLENNCGCSAVALACLLLAGFRLLLSVLMMGKGGNFMRTSNVETTNADRNRRHQRFKIGVRVLTTLYVIWIALLFLEKAFQQQQLKGTEGQANLHVTSLWPAAVYWLVYFIGSLGLLEVSCAHWIWQSMFQLQNEKKVLLKRTTYTLPELSTSYPDVQKNSETRSTCAVCLEDFELEESIAELPCGHIFHHDCIREWLVTGGDCPFRCS